MKSAGTIVAFGEVLLRLKAPGAHRLLQKDVLEASFGGAEFNVLASLAQFGFPCELVTALPNNEIGMAALQEVRRFAVGTSHVQQGDGRMGLYFLEAAADLRPGRVLYDRADSTFARHNPEEIDWDRILDGARWLHLTGITAALGDRAWGSMIAAAQAAERMHVPISFDVNMRQSLWAGSKRSPREAMRPLLDRAAIIFAGAADSAACLDSPVSARQPSEALPTFLEQMIAAYPIANAIVASVRIAPTAEHQSLSAIARLRGTGDLCRSRTIDIRNVVDRVGAGDALVAGCLAGVLHGRSWPETLDLAVMAGALKHSIAGDINRCSLAEIEAALASDRQGHLLR